jgi:MFS transporter, PPP family, 3-phenylpropionic acid transporter
MSLIGSSSLGVLHRFILLYVLMYAAFGAASPFWPLFFESRGLTPEQLGFLLALGQLARLIAGPLAGRVADILGALRASLATCASFAALLTVGLLTVEGFWPLAVIHMAHAAMLAPITALADAIAVNAARAPQKGFEYGWVRGSASAAFIAGTLAAGQIVGANDLSAIAWMQAALLAGVVLSAPLVPPLDTSSAQGERELSSTFGGIQELCKIALFRRVVLVAALVYGSHAMHDAFAPIRWNAAGISTTATSLLWSEAVAAEVLVFFWIGPALLNRIGPSGAAALAAAAGIVRWVVMSQSTALVALALVQPLHGLTFALLHLACMRIIALVVPIHLAATAQALYAVGSGAAIALMTVVSGQLYGQLGAHAFLAMALLCALALQPALGLQVAKPGVSTRP